MPAFAGMTEFGVPKSLAHRRLVLRGRLRDVEGGGNIPADGAAVPSAIRSFSGVRSGGCQARRAKRA
ncbi:MAG TPA: hypothetical protein VFN42_11485 [Acetobacteraceae bacterium]|nr:hypothetical protein [Acetobacteraceae bacterium]